MRPSLVIPLLFVFCSNLYAASTMIEEIVVTAQKRSENLQDYGYGGTKWRACDWDK